MLELKVSPFCVYSGGYMFACWGVLSILRQAVGNFLYILLAQSLKVAQK
jgi:hypothetical protein